MSRPLRIEYPGAFYHVTSRGNERKNIFMSNADRQAFLSYLESATVRYGAVIHAYCLMDNHYHLFLETPEGNLSQIMRHINGAYTIRYNIKRNRSGHLFQGRYKAILVDVDSYAMELTRYIHLNPVRAGIVTNPAEYRWSSYPAYVGIQTRPDRLKSSFMLSLFAPHEDKSVKILKAFTEETIGKEIENPLDHTVASTFLGGQEFIDRISNLLKPKKTKDRNIPALEAIKKRPTHDRIAETVTELSFDDNRLARKITIHLARKLTAVRLKELADIYGISESAVTVTSVRLLEKAKDDKRLHKLIEKAERRVRM